MRINQGCISHIGRRQTQQDAFGFSNFEDKQFISHGGVMAVVCDGMGGLEKGDEAANLAVKTILDCYMAKTADQTISDVLDHAVSMANKAVYELGQSTNNLNNVGTTLVLTVIHKQQLFWRTVGDSHLYLLRKSNLGQLNTDHTYTQELLQNLETNKLTQYDAINHPRGSALVSYLGIEENLLVDKNDLPIDLKLNDTLLLCTDGLYNSLSEESINVTLQNVDPMTAVRDLQHQVLDKQYLNQDNLTGVVLKLQKGCHISETSFFSLKARAPFVLSLLIAVFGYLIYVNIDYLRTVCQRLGF